MSKLGDAIRRSQRVESAPMGFGAARPAVKPSMLVGFIGDAAKAAAAREAGAELLVAQGGKQPPDLAGLKSGSGEVPLGLSLAGAAPEAPAKDSGLDFLVFEAESTPAAALLNETLGYVLELPDSPGELFLRSLESLSLEAIYVRQVPAPFTVARQMELGRTAMLSRKPLICRVDPGISAEDLQCLRAVGTAALLVDSAEAVATLKTTVAALPPRKQRREDRPVVSLPRGRVTPEEDDDDDDSNAMGRA